MARKHAMMQFTNVSPHTVDAMIMSDFVMGSLWYCGEMKGPQALNEGSSLNSLSIVWVVKNEDGRKGEVRTWKFTRQRNA
jgi:hypothetical protein